VGQDGSFEEKDDNCENPLMGGGSDKDNLTVVLIKTI